MQTTLLPDFRAVRTAVDENRSRTTENLFNNLEQILRAGKFNCGKTKEKDARSHFKESWQPGMYGLDLDAAKLIEEIGAVVFFLGENGARVVVCVSVRQ